MPSQLVTARGQPSLHTVPYMPYPTTAALTGCLPQNLQLPKNNVQFAMHPTAIQLQPPLCITSIVLTPVNGLQGIDCLAFKCICRRFLHGSVVVFGTLCISITEISV